MGPLLIALMVFGCISGSALAGMFIQGVLPKDHLGVSARDTMVLGLGLITTMNALVLGLLISSAKTAYDKRGTQVTEIAADVIFIDRSLGLYGPAAREARDVLKNLIVNLVRQIKSTQAGRPKATLSDSEARNTDLYLMVRKLSPRTEEQKSLKAEALRSSIEIGRIRALALAQESSSIPMPLLVVLTFWLVIIFAGYGLFAPLNLTVLSVLGVCSLAVSAAVFMIVAMDQPFRGVMQLSVEPLATAAAIVGR